MPLEEKKKRGKKKKKKKKKKRKKRESRLWITNQTFVREQSYICRDNPRKRIILTPILLWFEKMEITRTRKFNLHT